MSLLPSRSEVEFPYAVTEDNQSYQFLQFPTIPGYHYTVEVSADLVAWQPARSGFFYGDAGLKSYFLIQTLPNQFSSGNSSGGVAVTPRSQKPTFALMMEVQFPAAGGSHARLNGLTPLTSAAWSKLMQGSFPPRSAGTAYSYEIEASEKIYFITVMASPVPTVPTTEFASTDANIQQAATLLTENPQWLVDLLTSPVASSSSPPISGPHAYYRIVRRAVDTNGNGLPDWFELAKFGPGTAFAIAGSSAYIDPNADPDGDGLTNAQELTLGTNPKRLDTDNDGASDSEELKEGTDPKDAASFPPMWVREEGSLTYHWNGNLTSNPKGTVAYVLSWFDPNTPPANENLTGPISFPSLSGRFATTRKFPATPSARAIKSQTLEQALAGGTSHITTVTPATNPVTYCSHADLKQIRIWLKRGSANTDQPLTRSAIHFRQHTEDGVKRKPIMELTAVTVPVGSTYSQMVPLHVPFDNSFDNQTNPPIHSEILEERLIPLDLSIGIPRMPTGTVSPQNASQSFPTDNHVVPTGKEDTEGGWAVVNFDDDDQDTNLPTVARADYKPDVDDTNGVAKENDFLLLSISGGAPGVTFRLKFDSTNIRLWKTANKGQSTDLLISEQTEFFIPLGWERVIVYVEGIKPHDNADGTIITQQFRYPPGTEWQMGDTVKIRVAHPVVALYGDGSGTALAQSGSWDNARDQAIAFAKTQAGEQSVEPTRYRAAVSLANGAPADTILFQGKNQSGADVCYSLTSWTGPGAEILARTCMATEGMNLIVCGHSNLGLGIAWTQDYTEYSQFWKTQTLATVAYYPLGHHPKLKLLPENAEWFNVVDKLNAIASPNPMNNYLAGIPGLPQVRRHQQLASDIPVAVGTAFPTRINKLTAGTVSRDYKWHYKIVPDEECPTTSELVRTIVQTTNPIRTPSIMRYRSLFLCQCSSFRQFIEGFHHGTVVSSWVPIRPTLGLTAIFLQGLQQGSTWEVIENDLENREPNGSTNPDGRGGFQLTIFP